MDKLKGHDGEAKKKRPDGKENEGIIKIGTLIQKKQGTKKNSINGGQVKVYNDRQYKTIEEQKV
jgi:hypothetical protein